MEQGRTATGPMDHAAMSSQSPRTSFLGPPAGIRLHVSALAGDRTTGFPVETELSARGKGHRSLRIFAFVAGRRPPNSFGLKAFDCAHYLYNECATQLLSPDPREKPVALYWVGDLLVTLRVITKR